MRLTAQVHRSLDNNPLTGSLPTATIASPVGVGLIEPMPITLLQLYATSRTVLRCTGR